MASPSTGKTERKDETQWPEKVGSIAFYKSDKKLAHENWQGASIFGYIRFGLRMIALFTFLFLCVPCYYIWRILRLPNPWPKLFLGGAAYCCGARVEISGTPLKRDVFFMSNHLSWLDIPVLGGASGTAFVSKKEISEWPIIGWLCKLNNTVFVSRANRMAVADQINQIRDALYETWAITVFPEGTTSDGELLLPFKSPLVQVMVPPPPGVLVQPIYLDYGDAAYDVAWIGEEDAPQNAWRLFTRKGSFKVSINFLEPFDPLEYDGRKAIAAQARLRIETAMEASLKQKAALKGAA